jgi:hypothetical protein
MQVPASISETASVFMNPVQKEQSGSILCKFIKLFTLFTLLLVALLSTETPKRKLGRSNFSLRLQPRDDRATNIH